MKPLCFVLMPFGVKTDSEGRCFNFDLIYQEVIRPAIVEAEMEPIRADEEKVGGIIHKPMFERLILSEYALADLTAANANVFYELGIRHAVRPYSTVSIFADGSRLPFDLGPMRALPYQVSGDGTPADAQNSRSEITRKLVEAREQAAAASTDSPVYQLLDQFVPPEIAHLKTDVFRDRVNYGEKVKESLQVARGEGVEAIRALEKDLGKVEDIEAGIIVDLLLSYRSTSSWDEMIRLVEEMPEVLKHTVLIREQYAFALNRKGDDQKAEAVLTALIESHGASSESLGLLGRIYKDRWKNAVESGNRIAAKGFLKQAISIYLRGFETDWRDAYPGVNAVTLMDIADDERREDLIPLVIYACKRRLESATPDYWDHATLMELAFLNGDESEAEDALCDAIAVAREPWEPETTANNLKFISNARNERGGEHDAIDAAIIELEKKSDQLS